MLALVIVIVEVIVALQIAVLLVLGTVWLTGRSLAWLSVFLWWTLGGALQPLADELRRRDGR